MRDRAEYLGKGYYKTKLEIASRLMTGMVTNPKIYNWSSSKDSDEKQRQLEDDLVVVAHDLAVKLIHYCSPVPEND